MPMLNENNIKNGCCAYILHYYCNPVEFAINKCVWLFKAISIRMWEAVLIDAATLVYVSVM